MGHDHRQRVGVFRANVQKMDAASVYFDPVSAIPVELSLKAAPIVT
jgi:hypothetical protein